MFATSAHKVEKRAAKRRGLLRWIRFRLEWLAVRCLTTALLALSPERAFRAAKLGARIACRLDRRHRRVALANLDQVYGDTRSAREKVDLLERAYESLALVPVELLWAHRLARSSGLARVFDAEAAARHAALFAHPRGVLLATGHLGSWEMGPFWFTRNGFHFQAVARPLDNPYLDAYLSGLRGGSGEALIAKLGAVRAMLDTFSRPGTVVAVLLDQHAGSTGTYADFLGSPASTNVAPLLVAKRKRIPILIGAVVRVAPMRFRFVYAGSISEAEVRAADAPELARRVNAAFGRLVRAYPDQWMWTHRRWRSRPAAELPPHRQP